MAIMLQVAISVASVVDLCRPRENAFADLSALDLPFPATPDRASFWCASIAAYTFQCNRMHVTQSGLCEWIIYLYLFNWLVCSRRMMLLMLPVPSYNPLFIYLFIIRLLEAMLNVQWATRTLDLRFKSKKQVPLLIHWTLWTLGPAGTSGFTVRRRLGVLWRGQRCLLLYFTFLATI